MKRYDLVIIGGGPAGYTAAMAAAQANMRVGLVENERLGGVCIHKGCIPTKSLVASCRFMRGLQHAEDFGMPLQVPDPVFATLVNRQKRVVGKLWEQYRVDLDHAGVMLHRGFAQLTGPNQIKIAAGYDDDNLEADHIILATGSVPGEVPGVKPDGKILLTTDHLVQMTTVPKSMIMLGGGYVACTYGSILRMFGCEVTIIEKSDRLLPSYDPEAGQFIQKQFERKGLKVLLSTTVASASVENNQACLTLDSGEKLISERALLAPGRVPNISNLGLESIGLSDTSAVNEFMQLPVENIYATGDISGISMLAHSAIAQARTAVYHLQGRPAPYRHEFTPKCVYTSPEIAHVGLTAEEARSRGLQPLTASFPFSAVGRAVAMGELDGLVTLTADAKSHQLIGGLIIGGQAAEMISLITLATQRRVPVEEFCHTIIPHPTFCEAIQEAAWKLKAQL
jgi:dihydrolipoamide dehydrogenase